MDALLHKYHGMLSATHAAMHNPLVAISSTSISSADFDTEVTRLTALADELRLTCTQLRADVLDVPDAPVTKKPKLTLLPMDEPESSLTTEDEDDEDDEIAFAEPRQRYDVIEVEDDDVISFAKPSVTKLSACEEVAHVMQDDDDTEVYTPDPHRRSRVTHHLPLDAGSKCSELTISLVPIDNFAMDPEMQQAAETARHPTKKRGGMQAAIDLALVRSGIPLTKIGIVALDKYIAIRSEVLRDYVLAYYSKIVNLVDTFEEHSLSEEALAPTVSHVRLFLTVLSVKAASQLAKICCDSGVFTELAAIAKKFQPALVTQRQALLKAALF